VTDPPRHAAAVPQDQGLGGVLQTHTTYGITVLALEKVLVHTVGRFYVGGGGSPVAGDVLTIVSTPTESPCGQHIGRFCRPRCTDRSL